MSSRYREARTLVRSLCRLPGEDRKEFRRKLARLRRHFEQFNTDMSELCQWWMGLRKRYGDPQRPASFGRLGDFLLEPVLEGLEADEETRDRWRQQVFDLVAGFAVDSGLPLPDDLKRAIAEAATESKTSTAEHLFERLARLRPVHRLVLLKAAAEWIIARFVRAMENWPRQRRLWEEEKREWEAKHPQLTLEIRERFTDVFRQLRDPEREDQPGVRRKNPRICPYERLAENKNNCVYAGEKGHSPLCWKYSQFVKGQREENRSFNPKNFWDDANRFFELCKRLGATARSAFQSPAVVNHVYPDPKERPARWRVFQAHLKAYLQAMNLTLDTLISYGCLPHCQKIGETGEKSQCQWNPHTELCRRYKALLEQRFTSDELKLEPLYREWRKHYLAGPRKPSFRYPSSRELPTPKIFGRGFYQVDLDRSIVRLRLDDMPENQWLEFGFKPWPRDYQPSKEQVRDRITSVQIHFVGTRARVGFRFDVPHRPSRFACTQDQIDELRSRRFPRAAQDQDFLDAARKLLLESFQGDPERELRLLAVDLGTAGACAAVFQGRTHRKDIPLRVVKLDQLYESFPSNFSKRTQDVLERSSEERPDLRGLSVEHIQKHLEGMSQRVSEIIQRRQQVAGSTAAQLSSHDLRRMTLHIAWMIRDWVRLNTRQIIAAAEEHHCDLIVFESLRGFRLPGYAELNPEQKRRLAMWSFGRIRRKVIEKAVERGMRVVMVPYFSSSQVCWRCGHAQQDKNRWRKNKKQRRFQCECGDSRARVSDRPACRCSEQLNSDANAARVLARVFWGELRLPRPAR